MPGNVQTASKYASAATVMTTFRSSAMIAFSPLLR